MGSDLLYKVLGGVVACDLSYPLREGLSHRSVLTSHTRKQSASSTQANANEIQKNHNTKETVHEYAQLYYILATKNLQLVVSRP